MIRTGPVKPLTNAEPALIAQHSVKLRSLLTTYRAKARPSSSLTPAMLREQIADLEAFLIQEPDSPYGPSLRSELASHYRATRRYTKALEHWDVLWENYGQETEGFSKVLADRALAYRSSLWASLGRTDALLEVAQEHQFRIFSESHLAQIWRRTLEATFRMARRPEIAYRCGPLALNRVAQEVKGRYLPGLANWLSPERGVSLRELEAGAQAEQFDMVAVYRGEDTTIVVPSVVHWSLNHYAAIVAEQDGRYLVEDPTFLSSVWMDAETLNAEASGYFLVPRAQLPSRWQTVSAQEGDQIIGRGYPQTMDDYDGPECTDGPCCDEGPGSEGTGSGTNECGMASWWVTEPSLNLVVSDVPMAYSSAFGPDFVLKLNWRQRDIYVHPYRAHFAQGWHSDLLSYIDSSGIAWGGLPAGSITLYQGSGFRQVLKFASGQTASAPDHTTGIRAVRREESGDLVELTVYYRNGSVDTFEPVDTYPSEFQIVSRADSTGRDMEFEYEDAGLSLVNRLYQITMADGAVFEFEYNDMGDVYRITDVTGPNSRAVSFDYDAWGLVLEGITDVEGIQSEFTYDPTTYWITAIETPYGVTTFDLTDQSVCGGYQLGCEGIDRSIVIEEPDGSNQVYAFYDNGSVFYDPNDNEMDGLIPDAFDTGQIPQYATNDPPVQTLDTVRNERNSHYWNRQQAAELSTLTPASFTAADFRLSRTRHWLADWDNWASLKTIGWELPPSPDGTNEVMPVFYDYAGKDPYNWPRYTGTNSQPAVISLRMPDGTTQYQYIERNNRGMRTMVVDRWVENSTVKYRTNTYAYASGTGDATVDGMLMTRHWGPDGSLLVSYGLYSTHPMLITSMTNALGEVTAYTYDGSKRLSTELSSAGLLSTHTYDGTSKRLIKVVDSVSGTPLRTNQFTWLAGYMRTHTDPRGMTRTFDCDFLGRLTTITYPDSTTEEFFYTLPAYTGFNTSGTVLAGAGPNSHQGSVG